MRVKQGNCHCQRERAPRIPQPDPPALSPLCIPSPPSTPPPRLLFSWQDLLHRSREDGLGLTAGCLPPGFHSLQFFATVVSQPGLREPSFIFVGFVDDTQFLCYNNQGESQRMEPRALWVKQMGPEYWERQTRTVKDIAKNSLVNLREAMGVYNHSEDGE